MIFCARKTASPTSTMLQVPDTNTAKAHLFMSGFLSERTADCIHVNQGMQAILVIVPRLVVRVIPST
jgi:hypothetical protein